MDVPMAGVYLLISLSSSPILLMRPFRVNNVSQDIELIIRELLFSLINTLLIVFTAVGQSIMVVTIFP
jgi:hypothetical protein